MKFEALADDSLDYSPCRYGMSRLFFRGPRRSLDSRYLAFIGGTDTYGKFIEQPYPRLIENKLGRTCVNFGVVNASADAYVNDPQVLGMCREADLTVIQLTGAQNLSNRFYKVHPRRNDRFLQASSVLRAIYNEVDFTEITFTRHLLQTLYETCPERFEVVRSELEQAWLARMRQLIDQVGKRAVLVWFSDRPLSQGVAARVQGPLQSEPMFVTREMVDQLRPLVTDVIEATPSIHAIGRGTKGMVVPFLSRHAAQEQMNASAHAELADQLTPLLQRLL